MMIFETMLCENARFTIKKSHVSDAISLAWAEEIVVVRPPSSAGFETIPNPQHTASTKEWQL